MVKYIAGVRVSGEKELYIANNRSRIDFFTPYKGEACEWHNYKQAALALSTIAQAKMCTFFIKEVKLN